METDVNRNVLALFREIGTNLNKLREKSTEGIIGSTTDSVDIANV